MKRWNKQQFTDKVIVMCDDKYNKLIDEYFDTHKTASILSVLNFSVDHRAKDWAILYLDAELWVLGAAGMALDDQGDVKAEDWDEFEANIREEIAGRKVSR